jgi:hypothetical protein
MGIQPTSGGRILCYAGSNVAQGGRDDDDTHDWLLQTFGGWHEPLAAVIEATPKNSLVRNDIFDCWPSWRWNRGTVALIGDAIHPMTPDLGQGACQAIVDGTTLAACWAEIRAQGLPADTGLERHHRHDVLSHLGRSRSAGRPAGLSPATRSWVRCPCRGSFASWTWSSREDRHAGRDPGGRAAFQASEPACLSAASSPSLNPQDPRRASASPPVRYRPAVALPWVRLKRGAGPGWIIPSISTKVWRSAR